MFFIYISSSVALARMTKQKSNGLSYRLLDKFNKNYQMNKLLFFGLNTIDIQFLVSAYPQINTKTKASKNGIYVGGPATNAAIACAALGSRVDLFTVVGQHTFSDFIQKELSNLKVQVTDIAPKRAALPTFASIITSQDTGDRTVFSNMPEALIIDNNFIDKIKFADYDLILLDGFYMEFAVKIAQKAQKYSIPVVFDGGSWKPNMDKLLSYVDIAICSNDFCPPDTKKEELFDFLKNKGISYSAVTCGHLPIKYQLSGNQVRAIPVKQCDVFDTLGAGDFFHGAFCHYYHKGVGFEKALKQASVIATKSCQYFGTREWLKEFIPNW